MSPPPSLPHILWGETGSQHHLIHRDPGLYQQKYRGQDVGGDSRAVVSVGQATAADPVGRTSGQPVSQALLHPAVPGFQPLWAPLRPTPPGPWEASPLLPAAMLGSRGCLYLTPPLPCQPHCLSSQGRGWQGSFLPRGPASGTRGEAALRSPLIPNPDIFWAQRQVLPASCPNRRPQEAPRSFGRHSPATNSCFPSCELPLALRAQNWLPACGAPGGETEVWGVACWLSKHTAPPPRRVGPLWGARDSQRSHALDTAVRRLGQGPCWPLCTGLPTGVLDGQTSPWDCPPPLTLSSVGACVCPHSGRGARPCSAHSLRGPEGLEAGAGRP